MSFSLMFLFVLAFQFMMQLNIDFNLIQIMNFNNIL